MTLPNIKWGLLYGVILCNARAMGEFGAVSVVSGHIRGQTNTMPLHVEILYNEYNFAAAFAVASLLALLALVTLAAQDTASSGESRPEPARETSRRSDTHEHRSPQHQQALRQLSRRCDDVSLEVPAGELVALLGPSGSRQDHAAAHHRRAGDAGQPAQVLLPRRGRDPHAGRASARSASCSSTTRCSAT